MIMKIQLLAFGAASEIVNPISELVFDKEISVAQFRKYLVSEFPEMNKLSSFAIAINEAYIDDEKQLQNNDIVAIIPPVSGG
ncbi:MAG TPA: molybdopterin synthase sulfur carrier subunit [Tenacibaculum sp.]|nr:molybdopterin synthase sulfur carrier subunit [Tenacibaculum sp.]HBI40801.1 molybdopterin synthase sulfur carrier subunit [Tenacibaculum sp.]